MSVYDVTLYHADGITPVSAYEGATSVDFYADAGFTTKIGTAYVQGPGMLSGVNGLDPGLPVYFVVNGIGATGNTGAIVPGYSLDLTLRLGSTVSASGGGSGSGFSVIPNVLLWMSYNANGPNGDVTPALGSPVFAAGAECVCGPNENVVLPVNFTSTASQLGGPLVYALPAPPTGYNAWDVQIDAYMTLTMPSDGPHTVILDIQGFDITQGDAIAAQFATHATLAAGVRGTMSARLRAVQIGEGQRQTDLAVLDLSGSTAQPSAMYGFMVISATPINYTAAPVAQSSPNGGGA